MAGTKLGIHLSYLLRHNPGALELDMDRHGWVDIDQLINRINGAGKYRLDRPLLERIVEEDNKGRFRISPDGLRIKACQGHTIQWVEPELCWGEPPAVLYHGTTADAREQIMVSGGISRMSRHAVHLQAAAEKAWLSARRWRKIPVVLVVDARKMALDGFRFGVSDNGVWCTEFVPSAYIIQTLCEERPE